MQTVFQFLGGLSDFLNTVLSFDVLPGITLFTVFFYDLLFVCVVTALTRRG